MLKNFISSPKRKLFVRSAIILLIPFLMFFNAVSTARFGDSSTDSLYRYGGESMINFNGNLYPHLQGTTNGEAYFTLLTRIFNRDNIAYNTAEEKWDWMERKTGVRSQFFYTFVGAFLFEFGKTGTLLLAVLFFLTALYVFRVNFKTSMSQLLICSIIMYMFIGGVFVFNLQGSTGNLTIFLTIFLMLYFKKWNFKETNHSI
jgi:oligosaccharide repeat unit polymerase